ncbi:hypothetical protein DFJ63DRAFT_315686 [Scheffersomyces coipomensis]|uniref:uncharacterized protein n=1 Tax=Scheffersomyces coipomensis TaxID=1788519 RepID=UPI00315D0A6A
MSSLSTLTHTQKTQIRNAFKLIDGESRDALITKTDLIRLYKTLGMSIPSEDTLSTMLQNATPSESGSEPGINFTQFSTLMADELSKFEDRHTIYNALQIFNKKKSKNNNNGDPTDLEIDVDELKSACCSVQLGEIGSGDHKLSPQVFDAIIKGYVKQTIEGKKIFLVNNWLESYIE